MSNHIHSDEAAKPVAAYTQAVRAGDLVFVSGCIPINPATGDLISESNTSKNQLKRIVDNLGERYFGEVFENIKPGDYMTESQQKRALKKFMDTGDLNALKKYINA